MNWCNVICQQLLCWTFMITNGTLEWFFAFMNWCSVFSQAPLFWTGIITNRTHEWSSSSFVNICNHKWNICMVSCPRELKKFDLSISLFLKIYIHKWNTCMVPCWHELKLEMLPFSLYFDVTVYLATRYIRIGRWITSVFIWSCIGRRSKYVLKHGRDCSNR